MSGPQGPIYLDGDAPTERRVADLLDRMTHKEKVGQLVGAAREDISVNIFADEPDRTFDPVFVLATATVLFGGTTYLITAIRAEINTRLNQTAATFSLQFVAPIAILALLGPVFGKLADRYGRRPFLVVSGLFVVPGVLLQGFATSSMVLLAGSYCRP